MSLPRSSTIQRTRRPRARKIGQRESPSHQQSLWSVASLPGVELFRATALRQHYARHSHEGFALGVFEDGIGGTTYRGATCYIPPMHIVAMNPDEPHTGFAADARGITYRMLYVAPRFFEESVQVRSRPWFTDVSIDDELCARQLVDVHRHLERGTDVLRPETSLFEVLSTLVGRYGGTNSRARVGDEPVAVIRAKEFLRANYNRNVSLRDVAAAAELSPAYLIRTFRRAVGMPPYSWLLQLRIATAKKLLANGTPFAAIAFELGFSDQSHFTRRFRSTTGLTPGEYVRGMRRVSG